MARSTDRQALEVCGTAGANHFQTREGHWCGLLAFGGKTLGQKGTSPGGEGEHHWQSATVSDLGINLLQTQRLSAGEVHEGAPLAKADSRLAVLQSEG